VKQPVKQLRAFQRVHLDPGQTTTVTLSFKVSDLAIWDVTQNKWTVEKSAHDIMVGGASDKIRQRTTLNVKGEKIPDRDLFTVTRAADFDDYSGVTLVDETKVSGDAVGKTHTGDWISFDDADLGKGASGFTAGVAATAPGRIDVHLDTPTGTLIGTAEVPATGGPYAYSTVTAPLAKTHGVHDVYLVFTGDVRIKDVVLTR
jgi:beta-glucosidase